MQLIEQKEEQKITVLALVAVWLHAVARGSV